MYRGAPVTCTSMTPSARNTERTQQSVPPAAQDPERHLDLKASSISGISTLQLVLDWTVIILILLRLACLASGCHALDDDKATQSGSTDPIVVKDARSPRHTGRWKGRRPQVTFRLACQNRKNLSDLFLRPHHERDHGNTRAGCHHWPVHRIPPASRHFSTMLPSHLQSRCQKLPHLFWPPRTVMHRMPFKIASAGFGK